MPLEGNPGGFERVPPSKGNHLRIPRSKYDFIDYGGTATKKPGRHYLNNGVAAHKYSVFSATEFNKQVGSGSRVYRLCFIGNCDTVMACGTLHPRAFGL